MRFVPIQSLKPNAKLGRNIFNNSGEMLLRQGVVLTGRYIKQLKEKQINGVYVDDDISKNIEILSIIDEKVKNETLQVLKKTFSLSTSSNKKKKLENQENMQNIKLLMENIVDQILGNRNMMLNLVDLKMFDDYTFHHSVNVAMISIMIGISLDLNKKQLFNLGLSAILHDIGKVFVPENVLNKNGKLDDEEWEVMQEHPYFGYQHLKENYPSLSPTVYVGVLQHHERWDGSGYPDGKKGEDIYLFGRIIAIADVYDALTSDRPYRKAMFPAEALEYIMGASGSHFDLSIVQKFTQKITPYPLGTIVLLSNKTQAIVVGNYENFGLRPKVRVLTDNKQNKLSDKEQYTINLSQEINYTIIRILEL